MSVFKEKQAIYYYDKSEDKHLYKIWEIKRLKIYRQRLKTILNRQMNTIGKKI